MAGPGKSGPPKPGGEVMQHEEIKTAVLEMWANEIPRPTLREIARRVGFKSHEPVHRIIRQEVYERHKQRRDLIVDDMDRLAEAERRAAQDLLDFHEEAGSPPAPQTLTAIASTLTSLSRYWGIGADVQIDITVDGEVKHTVADELVESMGRLLNGLDAMNLDGVGSGRSPEEQVAALESIGPVLDVIDAEVIEDEVTFDDIERSAAFNAATPDVPGRWVGGKFIPFWDEDNNATPSTPSLTFNTDFDDEPFDDPDPAFYNAGPDL